ncbi:MAG: GNAT family N-acetyltransferase, partial [Planctomycetota bacterium]|nr:GNAT family N-acetyltransferase [Planctomycetota bacterium]
NVNEQNRPAVEFYLHLGFKIAERSEIDDRGNPISVPHRKR